MLSLQNASSEPAVLPDSYKMEDYAPERRRHRRRPVRFRAEAKRLDHTLAAHRAPRFPLTVLDISVGGIRATSRMPVVDGERLQIMLSQEELRALEDWRFAKRMPSRAAAVRELLRRGLAAEGFDLAGEGVQTMVQKDGVQKGA